MLAILSATLTDRSETALAQFVLIANDVLFSYSVKSEPGIVAFEVQSLVGLPLNQPLLKSSLLLSRVSGVFGHLQILIIILLGL